MLLQIWLGYNYLLDNDNLMIVDIGETGYHVECIA